MPTVNWIVEEYRVRYHYSTLERFDLQKRLDSLQDFLKFLIVSSQSRRRREGDGFYARRRRFMGIFITMRCIEETRAQLFRKRAHILYPSFNFYPGGASDPWWEEQ